MKTLLNVLFVLVFFSLSLQAQTYQIVVHESVAISELDREEVSKIFLKEIKNWDDGSKIIPIDQNARSSTRALFSEDIHGRAVGAIRSHWQQAAFSGAGTAPVERSSDADVIAFVKNNPGAIGYVSGSADVSSLKIITVK